jgi:Skp family chaperone for outer membrane proteins
MTRKHRGITAFLPVLLLGLIGPLRVQGQEMLKVGVLHVARAIFESEEGKTEMADLQKKVDAKQEEFAKQQKEIQDLQAQIQRQGATLNQEAQAALARNLENKQIFFQRATEDAQKEFNQLRQDIFNRIGRKIAAEVQKYATENNFYLILDSSSQNSQVLFNTSSVDITTDIIKRFNLSQTTPSTPAAAPPPAQ